LNDSQFLLALILTIALNFQCPIDNIDDMLSSLLSQNNLLIFVRDWMENSGNNWVGEDSQFLPPSWQAINPINTRLKELADPQNK
jgi:hypothetical protein